MREALATFNWKSMRMAWQNDCWFIYACQHFTSTKTQHLHGDGRAGRDEFNCHCFIGCCIKLLDNIFEKWKFYQSDFFFFFKFIDASIRKLIWSFSSVQNIMCALTLPYTIRLNFAVVLGSSLCMNLCPQPAALLFTVTTGKATSPAVWIPCQGGLRNIERFSCLLAPCRTSEYSIGRCFAAVVQHRGWARSAWELLLAAFAEESRLRHSADFIQALEMLPSVWHSACFFSAVTPDGPSWGEGQSWKDVKEVQLNCATEEYVYWAKTKTD